MPSRSLRLRAMAVVAAMAVLGACGSGGGDGGSPSGKDGELVAQVASFDLAVGPPSRFLVGVLSNDRRFLVYGKVNLRFAYLGTKETNAAGTYGSPVSGTFLAIPGSSAPAPSPPPAEPRLSPGSEARGVYAAVAGFDKAGYYQVEVAATVGGKEQKASAAFAVNETRAVPGPGDAAIPTDNLTLTSTDAPRAAIDSRAASGDIPDPDLHRTTIAAAMAARRPAVVVFATPVYCQSQFCGPVTDMVDALGHTYGDRASFIHVEIWRDFQNRVINKSAADWLLRNDDLNEPWVYVIGADGRIMARFDNVATAAELEPMLKQMPVIGPA